MILSWSGAANSPVQKEEEKEEEALWYQEEPTKLKIFYSVIYKACYIKCNTIVRECQWWHLKSKWKKELAEKEVELATRDNG